MKQILFAAWAFASLTLASCRRPESSAPAAGAPRQTFSVQGFLRGIDFAGRSVSVEHEEIPGYMPAMTMPFDVKTMTEVEPLKAGDAIEFTMIVTGDSMWIEGVKRIEPGEIQLPARKERPEKTDTDARRLKEGDSMPGFQLVDSKGRQITRESFAGKPLLLTFIFTRCPIPNFCPLMTGNFLEIQRALPGDAPQAADVQLLSISIDPEFDTPEVLAEYAARHTQDTDRWRFATGTAAATERLTRAFSVSVEPAGGTIAHGLATALIDADGAIRRIWRGNGWKPAEVIEALRPLSAETRKP